jgi:ABC-type branched-subunit amino acid transport system ATPase component
MRTIWNVRATPRDALGMQRAVPLVRAHQGHRHRRLFVEQNAKQGLAIADRGYLLDNGHIVGSDSAEALSRDEKIRKAYLGAG